LIILIDEPILMLRRSFPDLAFQRRFGNIPGAFSDLCIRRETLGRKPCFKLGDDAFLPLDMVGCQYFAGLLQAALDIMVDT
jgi:hypothetical protein